MSHLLQIKIRINKCNYSLNSIYIKLLFLGLDHGIVTTLVIEPDWCVCVCFFFVFADATNFPFHISVCACLEITISDPKGKNIELE
ncbi:hypothetical protein GDO81_024349 [Engystomops pustulosus]|uniref:Uncharacterized protein n=1 Tax=Engystomops pustulosus TaxID=76066 RepID=A0AAV6Z1T7_ENGPU|nr:hypothetical protein GDO81_024349 [Engystomops pustulosus]